MMISERCGCGSEFTYDDNNPMNTSMVPTGLPTMLADFRINHKCPNVTTAPVPTVSPF